MPFVTVPSKPPSLRPLEPTHQDRLSKPLPGLGCPVGTSGSPSIREDPAAPMSIPTSLGRKSQLREKSLREKRLKQKLL